MRVRRTEDIDPIGKRDSPIRDFVATATKSVVTESPANA